MVSAGERWLEVGLLTPHAAAGPEIEIPDLSQGRVAVTVARIESADPAGAGASGPATASPSRSREVEIAIVPAGSSTSTALPERLSATAWPSPRRHAHAPPGAGSVA